MTKRADGTGEVSQKHVEQVQSSLSTEQRIALARQEGARAPADIPSASDRRILDQLLLIIALDAETRVRQALAETLAENPSAPHDLSLRLARDEDLIAAPLLRLSKVLTSQDLVDLISSQISLPKMAAIADRREVPEQVCLALVDYGNAETASRLLKNPGADIPEPGLLRIVDRYGTQEEIQVGLIDRRVLPATVMEKAVALVSSELLTRMVDRHKMPVAVAAKIMLGTRNRAILGLTSGIPSDSMTGLVEQICNEGRLTNSLLLRSLCVGNMEFIIHVIAYRARLTVDYVRNRVAPDKLQELGGLWSSAKLPSELLSVVKAAVGVLASSEIDGAKWDPAYYRKRIVERMMSCVDELVADFSQEDVAYLIEAQGAGAMVLGDFGPSDLAPA